MDVICYISNIRLEFFILSMLNLVQQRAPFSSCFLFVDCWWKRLLVILGTITTHKIHKLSCDLFLSLIFCHLLKNRSYVLLRWLVRGRSRRWTSHAHTFIRAFILLACIASFLKNFFAFFPRELSKLVLTEPLQFKTSHNLIAFIVEIVINHNAPVPVWVELRIGLFFLVLYLFLNHRRQNVLLSTR